MGTPRFWKHFKTILESLQVSARKISKKRPSPPQLRGEGVKNVKKFLESLEVSQKPFLEFQKTWKPGSFRKYHFLLRL
jgi:hypothetical protein